MSSRVLALVADSGPFDTISGLPVHPLVVHGAVVLLPVAALAVIALVLVRRWRGTFGWLTLLGLTAGAGAAVAAEKSGEALAARVGMPREHAEWGERLPLVAVVLLVVTVAWFLMARRADQARASVGTGAAVGGGSAMVTVGGVLAAVLALATIGMTVIVGHSGATAVWSGRIAPTSSSTSTTGASAPSGPISSSSASGGAATGATAYTMAQVATHNTKDSCWAAVSGGVYDLTAWIDQHKGGADVIKGLCGTDGTAAFTAQHRGAGKPTDALARFKIGTLA